MVSNGTGSSNLLTAVELGTDGTGAVKISVSPHSLGVERAWIVRIHLRPHHRLELVETRGVDVKSDANDDNFAIDVAAAAASLKHIQPRGCDANAGAGAGASADNAGFPFAGAGHAPPCLAGAIAEFRLPASSKQRTINARMIAH